MIKNRYTAAITDKPWWLAGGIPQSACVAAYQPKGASSYEASKMNLTGNATYNAADGAAYPTWDATGWTFNGSSQYLTNGFSILSMSYIGSCIVRFSNADTSGTGYRNLIGAVKSGGNFDGLAITNCETPTLHSYRLGPRTIAISGRLAEGVMAVAGPACYLNGVFESALNNASTYDGQIVIGALAVGSTTNRTNYYKGNINAIAIYNVTLTNYQIAALTNAMNAL